MRITKITKGNPDKVKRKVLLDTDRLGDSLKKINNKVDAKLNKLCLKIVNKIDMLA